MAILASLGVHGLLWFGLPLIPASTPQPPEPRTLTVVELSPLEQQARLPQTSLFQPTSPLPQPSPNATGSNMPLVPVDPNLPDPNPYYQIPDTSTNSSSNSSSLTTKGSSRKSTKTQQQQQQTKDSNADKSEDNETKPDESSNRSEDLTDPDGKALSKSREDQEKLALQQSFAFNATGTTDQEVRTNFGSAASKIGEKFNIENWDRKPVSITIPYPKEACPFQHDDKPVQGSTGLIVVVLPDGSLGDTALMFKSSGFKGLDDAASKFVAKQWSDILKQSKVEPGSKPKALVLEGKIAPTPEDCAGTQKPAS